MPSPFIHTAVAFTCHQISHKPLMNKVTRASVKDYLHSLWPFLVVANIPDLDFIPGILVGDPTRFHHFESHSLFFGLVVSFLLSKISRAPFWALLLVGLSHPLLDLLTWDSYGFYSDHHGIPLFWPFSNHMVDPLCCVFAAPYVGVDLSWLFSWLNFKILLFEFTVSSVFAATVYFIARKRRFVR